MSSLEAEDDVSVSAHVKWLQKEFKRTKRDIAGISDKNFK